MTVAPKSQAPYPQILQPYSSEVALIQIKTMLQKRHGGEKISLTTTARG